MTKTRDIQLSNVEISRPDGVMATLKRATLLIEQNYVNDGLGGLLLGGRKWQIVTREDVFDKFFDAPESLTFQSAIYSGRCFVKATNSNETVFQGTGPVNGLA